MRKPTRVGDLIASRARRAEALVFFAALVPLQRRSRQHTFYVHIVNRAIDIQRLLPGWRLRLAPAMVAPTTNNGSQQVVSCGVNVLGDIDALEVLIRLLRREATPELCIRFFAAIDRLSRRLGYLSSRSASVCVVPATESFRTAGSVWSDNVLTSLKELSELVDSIYHEVISLTQRQARRRRRTSYSGTAVRVLK